jgi:hypothetical protein
MPATHGGEEFVYDVSREGAIDVRFDDAPDMLANFVLDLANIV